MFLRLYMYSIKNIDFFSNNIRVSSCQGKCVPYETGKQSRQNPESCIYWLKPDTWRQYYFTAKQSNNL